MHRKQDLFSQELCAQEGYTHFICSAFNKQTRPMDVLIADRVATAGATPRSNWRRPRRPGGRPGGGSSPPGRTWEEAARNLSNGIPNAGKNIAGKTSLPGKMGFLAVHAKKTHTLDDPTYTYHHTDLGYKNVKIRNRSLFEKSCVSRIFVITLE